MTPTSITLVPTGPAVEDRVVYIPIEGGGTVFGQLSVPSPDRGRRAPVLLCGPWGWEDVSAHRSLRTWAHRLSADGRPALRIDLPGTGDSAGDATDPGLVDAWRAAVLTSAAWLAATCGTTSVDVVALGLSTLLVGDVLREPGASAIRDVVLWGPAGRGRSIVRQLQAFAKLERTSAAIDEHGEVVDEPAVEDDRLAPGGYLLSPGTQDALREIDLRTLAPEVLDGRRLLLLERDGMAIDAKLLEHLRSSGADVATGPGDGFGAMVEHPQTAAPPDAVLQAVDAWLATGTDDDGPAPPPVAATDSVVVLGGEVRETPLALGTSGAPAFGILTEPVDEVRSDVTVVFLNAGAQRRIGPNRMWVEAARRWAAEGVPSLRLDVGSIGDAPGPDVSPVGPEQLHDPASLTAVSAVLDLLATRGLPSRFMLVGLCSGAWTAFSAARHDPRVRSAVLFNARALVWNSLLVDARDARVGKRVVKGSQWRRVLRGEIGRDRLIEVGRAVAAHPAGALDRRRLRREVRAALERLSADGVLVSLIFTGREPLRAELENDGALDLVRTRPGLALVELAGKDHTLRPLSEQQLGHDLLDVELRRVLAAG